MDTKTITYKVNPKTRLDKIFTNGLPVNAFINKGRCAIGGTYLEIMNKSRCSIIVVPNISIILNKLIDHPDMDVVYGDVSFKGTEELLKVYEPGQKIMTTPEGMRKIMSAAEVNGRLEEITNDWLLLLDESHTFISEYYREDILLPFKYFWSFKKKSIISATPFEFTDTRFKDLQHYKITFTEPLGTIKLVNARSVEGTLNLLLQNASTLPGNLHIFLNSIAEIRDAILRAELTECHIYCADDKDGNNMAKLGDLAKHFVAEPKTGEYSKINFYTCKYFEGWDLHDDNATMVLVTNFHKEHTMVGVGSKGKQAIGRLRKDAYQIVHITNHKYINQMKPLQAYREYFTDEAKHQIDHHYKTVERHIKNGFKLIPDPRLKHFCDVDKTTHKATLDPMKLDQQINQAANNEIYNHIDFIKKDWEDAYFKVEIEDSDVVLETKTALKRKSGAKQLEEDYKTLLEHKSSQQASNVFGLDRSLENRIKVSNPTAYQAAKLIDEQTMIAMKYNVKKVQAEVILKEYNLKEVKLLKLIGHEFKVGIFNSNEDIKNKLQAIYNKLEVKDHKTGKIKIASAEQIRSKGLFEADDTKRNKEHGKIIIRAQFSLRMAA